MWFRLGPQSRSKSLYELLLPWLVQPSFLARSCQPPPSCGHSIVLANNLRLNGWRTALGNALIGGYDIDIVCLVSAKSNPTNCAIDVSSLKAWVLSTKRHRYYTALVPAAFATASSCALDSSSSSNFRDASSALSSSLSCHNASALPSAGVAASSSSSLRFISPTLCTKTISCLSAVVIATLTSSCFVDIGFFISSVIWLLWTELYL